MGERERGRERVMIEGERGRESDEKGRERVMRGGERGRESYERGREGE